MEVTDKILEIWKKAYSDAMIASTLQDKPADYDYCAKRGLEAVFAMVEKEPKTCEGCNVDEYKIMGLESELDILVDQILNAKDLDHLKETTLMNFPEKELPTFEELEEDNEGWIEWRSSRCPDLPIETYIEVKGFTGNRYKNYIGYAKRNFNWDNIIAYRVIKEEPKEKIPTLLEFAEETRNLDLHSPREITQIISEYLDKYMAVKNER